MVRFKADRAFIVTTQKVSRDARRIFSELSREAKGRRRTEPVFIEGVDQAENVMRQEVSRSIFKAAMRNIDVIGTAVNINLAEVIRKKIGNR